MPDDDKAPSTVRRDYRGTKGLIEDAEGGPRDEGRKLPRGRTGVSRGKSPRESVKYVDPDDYREGDDGEKAYGAPTSPPSVQEGESDKRRMAKPDPLKTKE